MRKEGCYLPKLPSLPYKKLNNKDCSNRRFDRTDWQNWLSFISNFFKTYNVSTILNSKPTNNIRPYVKININNSLDMYGLLDSGSAVTVLGKDIYKTLTNLNFPIIQDRITVSTAGGEQIRSLGYMLLPVIYNNCCRVIKSHIIPEINSPLILGIDFWTEFEIFPKHLSDIKYFTENDSNLSLVSPESDICLHSYNNLNVTEKHVANSILDKFKLISFEHKGLGRTDLISHCINTGDAEPIKQRYYRMSPEKQRIITEQVDEMLSLDVVEYCESPWSSPVLVVGKKDGKPRFCLDSRKLNSVTKKDAYNLPYVSEILDNLREAKFMSSIDLSKAFWQIPIVKEDREKTAFFVPGRGLMHFKVTAFGLSNAPATQQRLVDKLFGPEFELKVFCYLDDVIIISKTFEEHTKLLQRVLDKLTKANLTINLSKCKFFRNQLKYLGYVIDERGLRTDPEKVEAILNFPTPTTRKEVKRFLGTASWYRRFIPNFSTVAGPLNKLTSTKKKSPPFSWSEEADKAFLHLKSLLVKAPILACPNFDLPFEVHTDASDYGVGAMLCQTIDGVEHPVAFMSKSLSGAERNYSVTEREALAVLTALEHWRCYLENGKTFSVYTDHAALKWFCSLSNPSGRLARWGVRLSSFDYEIKHRSGKDNVIPDALSRSTMVSAISSDSPIVSTPPNTVDQWYLNIFNGCLQTPSQFLNYRVEGNMLYRYMKSNNALTSEFSWKEVPPKEFRDAVIANNHAEPTAAHLGIFKTYKRLLLRFYWPGMYKDTVSFISGCDVCLAYKQPTHQTLGKMGRPKVCSRPFQALSIDFVGPLPSSRKQNSYILVLTCCFSKYCFLFPLRNANAKAVCKILEDNIFLVHGVPQTVIMDNGSQFVSRELDALLTTYKVPNIHFTPKYTPQVNTVERYNKTIVTAISTFVNDDHRSWDVNLPKIQFAINSSVNEVTGYTPSFLVYGRELVTCGSHYIDKNDVTDDLVFVPRDEYAENLGHLAGIFNNVQASLSHSHQKTVKRYDLRRKHAEFNIGDIVWKRCFFQSDKGSHFTKKLAPKFEKCKVKGKRSPLVYILEDMSGRDLGCWHIKDLKFSSVTA